MALELGTDLKKNANAGMPMTLRHPETGADMEEGGEPVQLLLLGKDSDAYQRVERAFQKDLTTAARRARSGAIDPQVYEDHVVNRVVACTTGWRNCSYQGEETFSPELIRRLYRNEPWVLEQAAQFIEDRAHFTGASTTT